MDLFLFHLSTYYEYLFLYAYDDSLGKDQKSKLAIRKIRFIINSRRTHCIRYSNTKGAARWKRQKKLFECLEHLQAELEKQPHWGVVGMTQAPLAAYALPAGQTKKIKALFEQCKDALSAYLEATSAQQETQSEVMIAFLKGRVLQNYLWQKNTKVQKAIRSLLKELA